MAEEKEQRGFAGLAGLVSDIETEDPSSKKAATPQGQTKPEPHPGTVPRNPETKNSGLTEPHLKLSPLGNTENQPSPPPAEPSHTLSGREDPQHQLPSALPPQKTTNGIWVWAFLAIGLIVMLANLGDKHNNSSSTISHPQSTASPSSTPPKVSPPLSFDQPSISTNNVLSVSEIRWCYRQNIRIETIRSRLSSNEDVRLFNQWVEDLNSRCGNFRYRVGHLEQAKREVEAMREEIVREVLGESGQIARSEVPSKFTQTPPSSSQSSSGYGSSYTMDGNRSNPSYEIASAPTPAPKAAYQGVPAVPDARVVLDAQRLLKNLGYDPGPLDGKYGARTQRAIEQFQMDNALNPDGTVSDEVLSAMRSAQRSAHKAPTASNHPRPNKTAIAESNHQPTHVESEECIRLGSEMGTAYGKWQGRSYWDGLEYAAIYNDLKKKYETTCSRKIP